MAVRSYLSQLTHLVLVTVGDTITVAGGGNDGGGTIGTVRGGVATVAVAAWPVLDMSLETQSLSQVVALTQPLTLQP